MSQKEPRRPLFKCSVCGKGFPSTELIVDEEKGAVCKKCAVQTTPYPGELTYEVQYGLGKVMEDMHDE